MTVFGCETFPEPVRGRSFAHFAQAGFPTTDIVKRIAALRSMRDSCVKLLQINSCVLMVVECVKDIEISGL